MLSVGGCAPTPYSAARTVEDHASGSAWGLKCRKRAGSGARGGLGHVPVATKPGDAEADNTPNALLESLNTPLGLSLHVARVRGRAGRA